MSQSEFQERLGRIGAHGRAGLVADPAPMPRTRRDEGRMARVERAIALLETRGISRKVSYPPAYRMLAGLGLPPRPMHFQSPVMLAVLGFTLCFTIFGGLYASGLPEHVARGPVAGLQSAGWPGVVVISTGCGVALAILIRVARAGKNLPKWSEI